MEATGRGGLARAVGIATLSLAPLALVARVAEGASTSAHLTAALAFVIAAGACAALASRTSSLLASMFALRHGALALALFGLASLGAAGLAAAVFASLAWALRHHDALTTDAHALDPVEERRARVLFALSALGGGVPIALWAAPLALDAPSIDEEVLWAGTSRFQRLLVTRARGAVRLWLDGHLQLESGDEAAYHETLVHPALAAAHEVERALVLGGGDGLVARELLRDPRVREVVVVDIDRAVTSLARRFTPLRAIGGHALDDARVHLVHADARTWALRAHREGLRFDVIVGDLPDPTSELLAQLFAMETLVSFAALLTDGGVLALQAGAPRTTPRAFGSIVRTIEAAGLRATPLVFEEPVAFGGTAVVLGARERDPEPNALRAPTTWLTPTRLDAARRVHVPDARVTTLADLAVLGYLREAMCSPDRWGSP